MKKAFILSVVSALLLSSCTGGFDEKQAYIDATVEATCAAADAFELSDVEIEAKMQEIYAKYKFPVNDEAEMMRIVEKYNNDAEVISEINTRTEECRNKMLEDLQKQLIDIDFEVEGEDVLIETENEVMDEGNGEESLEIVETE